MNKNRISINLTITSSYMLLHTRSLLASFNFTIIRPLFLAHPPSTLTLRLCISLPLFSFLRFIIIPSLATLSWSKVSPRSSRSLAIYLPLSFPEWEWREVLWKCPLRPIEFLACSPANISHYQRAPSTLLQPSVILTPLPAALPCLRAVSLYLGRCIRW